MVISEAGVPLPLQDQACLQTRHGLGGSFWHPQAQWSVDLPLKHSPLLVLPPDGWGNLPEHWVVLRLQSMVDSNPIS